MIPYDFGNWGIGVVFKLHGSVFPKACAWAVPNALFTFALKMSMNYFYDFSSAAPPLEKYGYASSGFTALWSGFTFILGFLLVFRTQVAYSRFWEGCSHLLSVKGSWVNAVSNLVSFCSNEPSKREEVAAFQHLLVRLMSLLFQASLHEVGDLEDEHFETLGVDGIDVESLDHLDSVINASDVLLLWIQKLIVQNHQSGVIPIPPPILSRVFQELSNGIVDVQSAKKISEYPFPFPYSQMISFFLLLHYILSPFLASILISDPTAAAVVTFTTVFSVWSTNYIAAEIEMPFGDDPNDLPLERMQATFNQSLKSLMAPLSQIPPAFAYDEQCHPAFQPRRGRSRVGATTSKDSVRKSWGMDHWRRQSDRSGEAVSKSMSEESQPTIGVASCLSIAACNSTAQSPRSPVMASRKHSKTIPPRTEDVKEDEPAKLSPWSADAGGREYSMVASSDASAECVAEEVVSNQSARCDLMRQGGTTPKFGHEIMLERGMPDSPHRAVPRTVAAVGLMNYDAHRRKGLQSNVFFEDDGACPTHEETQAFASAADASHLLTVAQPCISQCAESTCSEVRAPDPPRMPSSQELPTTVPASSQPPRFGPVYATDGRCPPNAYRFKTDLDSRPSIAARPVFNL